MAITPGSRLGVYEVSSQIGEGGMGQVFRATDTRLKRQVALKILPPAVAADPDRLARFQREAEVLASLNHPHIAAIYGLEESGGVTALVMELVEGEDLADMISGLKAQGSGRTLPVDESLNIAKQIVDALEAAHERGIIHRDLKPANIKIRADGTVKVLDFGLAKALDQTPASSPQSPVNLTASPTITTPAMTQAGMILGTAAYMSPEQAKGRAADKRSDVWSFGCVLYEMLTGRRAFEGDDVADTLAAVLRAEPDWHAFPAAVPPHIRTIVKRCLEKTSKARIPDISVVRFMLADSPSSAAGDAAVVARPVQRSAWTWLLPWTIAAAAAAAAILLWAPWKTAPVHETVRLSAAPAADATVVASATGSAISLSPQGEALAFLALGGPKTASQIFVRRLDRLQATALQGTEGATNLFYSPDGQWIAFFADGKLKKVAASGGAVVTIANAPNPRGGSWGDDGAIVFAADTAGPLSRVSSAGGNPEPATTLAAGEMSHRWPQVLAGGAILYSASDSSTSWSTANLVVWQASSGSRNILQKGGYYGRYLPNGSLLYLRDGVLMVAPLDIKRWQLTGTPAPVLEGLATSEASGAAQFAFSQNGTLVYLAGQSTGRMAPMVWMNKAGEITPLRATAADWSNPQFSPDGSRIAMDISDGANTDVFVYTWARDQLLRLTFDANADQKPVWSPDGRRLAFSSARADKSTLNLYLQRADGAGDAQRLTTSGNQQLPGSWHPSGKYLAFTESRPGTQEDLMILPMEGDEASGWKPGTPTVFLSTRAVENEPMFSPDGRWIAYASNEAGTVNIYVRPFPGPGGKWQVSTDGATVPTWSRARQELLFRSITNRPMVVSYRIEGDSFVADTPQPWSSAPLPTRPRQRYYDVHPAGDRIALAPSTVSVTQDKVVFVFNFFDELTRLTKRSSP